MSDDPGFGFGLGFSTGLGLVCVGLLAGGLYGCPKYNVYSSTMNGQATLAEAEQSRQVTVRQAQADADAAVLHAQADVARAKGAAEANRILGDSLKGNEDYLRYLYITNLDNSANRTVVYVPTDGLIPTLETGRIGAAPTPAQ